MLEEWEQKSTLLLMGEGQSNDTLDLDDAPEREPQTRKRGNESSGYNKLFD